MALIDPDSHIALITHAIQLAIAPVFLLTAIGTIINALAGRLSRAVDRRRQIEDELIPALTEGDGDRRSNFDEELQILARRILATIRAIALAVISALLVCLLIGTAFAAAFVSVDLSRPVALLFIAAVIALTISLLLFMHEVFLAAQAVHPRMWPQPPRADRT
jgi:MFS family permease